MCCANWLDQPPRRLDYGGIDMNDVGGVLGDQGVATFAASYDGLLETLAAGAATRHEAA
jgi:hypothetical protein